MFKDRHQAGVQLATKLVDYEGCPDCIVFAIPRGGVVVAAEVARRLDLPLDLIVTKKIGAPFNLELAIGSVDPAGTINVDQDLCTQLNVSQAYLQTAAQNTLAQVRQQLEKYRKTAHYQDLSKITALIVDDGIATGQTVTAAINFVKSLNAQHIIVATPVISPSILSRLSKLVKEIRYLLCQQHFLAVGQFYQDFSPVDDNQVTTIMADFENQLGPDPH
ncbi:MAG TPA: phosphoribosyltransferase family protein [bacterium]|jgi:putative phosphoribosyl transferase|nr:phosphoribosyltransferase family protein [bacterium]